MQGASRIPNVVLGEQICTTCKAKKRVQVAYKAGGVSLLNEGNQSICRFRCVIFSAV